MDPLTVQYIRAALDAALTNQRVQLQPWTAQAIAHDLHVALAARLYGEEKDSEEDR